MAKFLCIAFFSLCFSVHGLNCQNALNVSINGENMFMHPDPRLLDINLGKYFDALTDFDPITGLPDIDLFLGYSFAV